MRQAGIGIILYVAATLVPAAVSAEPYLAVLEGQACGACHVSPSGGGMRNVYGNVYSKMLLPSHSLGDATQGINKWNGEFLKYLKFLKRYPTFQV